MRDAVTLEALGIPTVILINDVFTPIAHATATLLDLPGDYVARNVVWLPHPTSNLTRDAAATLVDERIELVYAALLGRDAPERVAMTHANGASVASQPDAVRSPAAIAEAEPPELAQARSIVAGLAESLRADGADLVLLAYDAGVLEGEIRIGDLTCDDGSCIMPTDALEKMVDAMVRPKVGTLRRVRLREITA